MANQVRREEYSSSNVVRTLHPTRPLSPPHKNVEYNNNNLGKNALIIYSKLGNLEFLLFCFDSFRCTIRRFEYNSYTNCSTFKSAKLIEIS